MSDPEKATTEDTDTPSFGQAMEELEAILQRIEGEEIDIDQLATELQRAAQLLDLARGKLRRAEVEVTQIVQRLESDEAAGFTETEDEPEGGDPDDDDIPF